MKTFNHTKYSRIIGWYLLLNGLAGLWIAFNFISEPHSPFNQTVFAINSILFPCLSTLIGYYLLIKESWCLSILPKYLAFSIPIIGITSWQYSHAFAFSFNFQLELVGLLVGINFLPIVWLWLLNKHYNLTRA